MTVEPDYLISGFSGNAWVINRLTEGLIHADSLLVPSYGGNIVNTGFTSRIACGPLGNWFSEQGSGASSGSLLENDLSTAPQEVSRNLLVYATRGSCKRDEDARQPRQ